MNQLSCENSKKVLLQFVHDTQLLLELLIKRVTIVEAKLDVKEDYADDELLRLTLIRCKERKETLIQLMNNDITNNDLKKI